MSDVWLSPREKQLLRRLGAGRTDAEIASHFRCRAEQVSEQQARLLKKLGIISEAQIAETAARLARFTNYKGKS
jgi:DNA-binding CsgD family transcriptional regulator